MGYEIEIYVGTAHPEMTMDAPAYFSVVGMLDISKPGYDSAIYGLAQISGGNLVYFYGTDGNTQITEDCYGTPLTARKPDDVLKALRKDAAADDYRRFKIAVDFLESTVRNFDDERLAVVLYGH